MLLKGGFKCRHFPQRFVQALTLSLGALSFSAPAWAGIPVPVTFRIIEILQETCDEGFPEVCPNDMFVKVNIASNVPGNTAERRDFGDGVPTVKPGPQFVRVVDSDVGTITIDVELWDRDDAPGGDDDIEISDGDDALHLTFNLNTHKWGGEVSENVGFSRGSGSDDAGVAQIRFGIAADNDKDQDGIPDNLELFGLRDAGGNMIADFPALGADPCRPTIAIEIDYMQDANHSHQPLNAAVNEIIAAFNAAPIPSISPCPYAGFPRQGSGVNLIIDRDDVLTEQQFATWGGPTGQDAQAIRDGNFDPLRRPYFHYSLWAHNQGQNPPPPGTPPPGPINSSSGLCCSNSGKDILVTLGSFTNQVGSVREQSGTLMHELGHALGFIHGGGDIINCKPNYLSVMSYSLQFTGVPDPTLPADNVDTNNNGTADSRFRLDYSKSSLGLLREPLLDESKGIGDGTDLATWTTNGGPIKVAAGNGPIDWNNNTTPGSPPNIDPPFIPVDLNNFNIVECGQDNNGNPNSNPNEDLVGFDDWRNIKYRAVLAAGAGFTPPPSGPELTFEDAQKIQTGLVNALNTTDLEIIKSDSPDMAVAGQELVYTLTAKNNGPSLARNVQVVDILPKQVTHISNTSSCVVDPSGKLTCNLGELRVGDSRKIQIRVHMAADLPCKKDDQFFTLTNNASVVNLSGPDSRFPDSNPSNNESSENTQVLCIKYEYAAKLICGKQKNPENMSLARGFYATSINIHNPNDEKVYFFKKLALTYPPEEQKPGSMIPIAIDNLQYDEALKADCIDIEKTLFKLKERFPTSYTEGFVIIQSPRSLDVTGVYTTANLDWWDKVKKHNSIHVEQIRERQRIKTNEKRPDLVVSKIDNLKVDCPEGARTCVTQVRVTISNMGTADATAFNTRVVFDPAKSITVNQASSGGLAAGASQSFTVKSPPDGNCFDPDCTICVTVDNEDDVLESDETNNELCESKAG